jgi:hypothetical protein
VVRVEKNTLQGKAYYDFEGMRTLPEKIEMQKVFNREIFWRKKGGRIVMKNNAVLVIAGLKLLKHLTKKRKRRIKKMSGKNLCFVREVSYIHDVLLETTDEGKTKEAVIGITGIIGEHEQNYRIMSRRLDKVQDDIAIMSVNISTLREQIKKLAEAVGVIL